MNQFSVTPAHACPHTNFTCYCSIFEKHAVGVLGECYFKDKDLSHLLLVRKIQFWDDLSLLTVADSASHMTFMGHSCSQTKLNKMWKGEMAVYTAIWKIIVTLIFPVFVFKIKFNADHTEKNDAVRVLLYLCYCYTCSNSIKVFSPLLGLVIQHKKDVNNKSSILNQLCGHKTCALVNCILISCVAIQCFLTSSQFISFIVYSHISHMCIYLIQT